MRTRPTPTSQSNQPMPRPESGRPNQPTPGGPELEAPDYCLIRLIDVKLEPGSIYEYRFKVRMINPNYLRQDVASPRYGEGKFLESADWFLVPSKVVVPNELEYYIADQKALDGRAYEGINATVNPKADQVVLQIHKWVENAQGRQADSLTPVGEWIVAERVPVSRGEYIDRSIKVDVPIWKETLERFVLPVPDSGSTRPMPTGLVGIGNPSAKPKPKNSGMEIFFGLESLTKLTDTILVDFDGGKSLYQRPTGKPVDEVAATEVLMLSPNGKLISRTSSLDASKASPINRDREDRLRAYRQRILEVWNNQFKAQPGGATTPRG